MAIPRRGKINFFRVGSHFKVVGWDESAELPPLRKLAAGTR
jgi:hypothetical protein